MHRVERIDTKIDQVWNKRIDSAAGMVNQRLSERLDGIHDPAVIGFNHAPV